MNKRIYIFKNSNRWKQTHYHVTYNDGA
jgi:hypothetical protein